MTLCIAGVRLGRVAHADATVQEAADELRQLECSRLDALQQAWWHRALSGQVKATQLLIKIMERRAKLLGLDAPARVNVKSTTELDARIEGLISELTALPLMPPVDDATRMLSQLQAMDDDTGQLYDDTGQL